MATLLYEVTVSTRKFGSVKAVPAQAISGHFWNGKIWQADMTAVRENLPYKWRKAFDRTGGVWYPKSGDMKSPAHATLRDRRGNLIGTLYLMPYEF